MKPTFLKLFITVLPLVLLVFHLTTKPLDAVGLGLLGLAILPWLSSILETAELPGGIKVKFNRVEEEQKRQARELDWIKLLITLTASDHERAHLHNLASDAPFIAEIRHNSTFEWELRHLTTLDFVGRQPGRGIRSLFAEEGSRDVKEHLIITQRGRDYLRIFEEAKLFDESSKTVA